MSKGRVCLAYSGGLDTSTILKWLINEGYTVVCFLANVGQKEDWAAVEKKALAVGAERMVILDLQRELVEQLVWPAIQCKGNKTYECRIQLMPNIVHSSYEAGVLEDPNMTPPKDLWNLTQDPQDAPDKPEHFTLFFEKGIPVKLVIGEETITDSLALFKRLNLIGYTHGVGRTDIVENRFIGLKSRGCYERQAHIDLESLVMDGKVRELRDQFCTFTWSRLLYNGMYFSPEREFVENSIVFSQQNVTGEVRLMAYKGAVYVQGRQSDASNLYSMEDASMDSLEGFSPMDTTGFIEIQSIRLKKYGAQKIKDGKPLTEA
ncbi:hypothetical protein DH86_00000370 [Scytalidium sp. 3C]|nr:hypothetical protein DH86_00000370 [Scytalidium sp. 3C]